MLDRIVEVFCKVDDFCQAFVPHWQASLLGPGGPAPRGPEPGLSPSEIITLLLVLHSSGFKYLKSFYHGFAEPLLRGSFPGMPCYEHFVVLQKSVFVPLVFFLLSHRGTKTGLYYIDSTALPVCDHHRIDRHKVFAGLAQRGKTSMGWFFGVKRHLVFNNDRSSMIGSRRLQYSSRYHSRTSKGFLETVFLGHQASSRVLVGSISAGGVRQLLALPNTAAFQHLP
jgi:hypothetical protein